LTHLLSLIGLGLGLFYGGKALCGVRNFCGDWEDWTMGLGMGIKLELLLLKGWFWVDGFRRSLL